MGLDVSAYSHLSCVLRHGPYARDGSCRKRNHVEVETFWRAKDIKTGCYERTPRSKSIDFRAGTYREYNIWRAWLSKHFLGVAPRTVWQAPRRYCRKPFYELIYFLTTRATSALASAGSSRATSHGGPSDFALRIGVARSTMTSGAPSSLQPTMEWLSFDSRFKGWLRR
jgi:hypothetical protein